MSDDEHHKRKKPRTGVLSDRAIIKELECNNLIIEPFDKNKLNCASYDISLGDTYCRRKPRLMEVKNSSEILISSSDHSKPISISEALNVIWDTPKNSKDEIVIYKGETVLCHSVEFIGSRKSSIVSQLVPKAIITFAGIRVDSGHGNIGYFNRWLLNITNTTNYDISLKVGGPIAQIVFQYSNSYYEDYSKVGIFQDSNKLDKLISGWKFPIFIEPEIKKDDEVRKENRLPTIIEEPKTICNITSLGSIISECNKVENIVPIYTE
jgi:deoxycytidine triphosphate deaminase